MQKLKNNKDINIRIKEYLDLEEIKAEKLINKLSIIILSISIITSLFNTIFIEFHKNVLANFMGLGLMLTYHFILFFILQKKDSYKPYFKYLTVIVCVSGATIIIWGYEFFSGWVYTLRSVTISAYLIPLILSGLYKRPSVTIFTAVLISIEYTLLFLYAVFFTNVKVEGMENFLVPSISIFNFTFFITLFIFLGLVNAYIAKSMKNMLAEALASKEEVMETTQRSRLKTEFFINLAHETKTPLTLISNYLDKYIQEYGLNKDIRVVKQNIDKLQQDMVNFLDAEKLEKGQLYYNHEQITDISTVLSDKVILFKESAAKKEIRITSDIQKNLYLKVDPYALDRIINNLLYNAIKYNKVAGLINIVLKDMGKKINMLIKDTGVGMAPEHQHKIFELYYQISHEKRNNQGIGMGLSITKQILDSISAEVKVESKPDVGSTFTIIFNKYSLQPDDVVEEGIISAPPLLPDEDIKLEPETYTTAKNTILVVEDNQQLLAYLQSQLKHEYNVYYANNGKVALAKLTTMPRPDLILSDIMMDEMDGYTFREALLAQDITPASYQTIPFIFLTAKNGAEEKLKGLQKGAIDFISKPFSMSELKAKITSLLKFQAALKEEFLKELENKMYIYLKKSQHAPSDLKTKQTVSNQIQKENVEREQAKPDKKTDLFSEFGISRREIEVISLIHHGFEHKEIAEQMNISLNTVKTYMKKIYEKCNVTNKVELINLFFTC